MSGLLSPFGRSGGKGSGRSGGYNDRVPSAGMGPAASKIEVPTNQPSGGTNLPISNPSSWSKRELQKRGEELRKGRQAPTGQAFPSSQQYPYSSGMREKSSAYPHSGSRDASPSPKTHLIPGCEGSIKFLKGQQVPTDKGRLTFQDSVGVSAADFGSAPGYIAVKYDQKYLVLSPEIVPMVAPGCILLSDFHRAYLRVSPDDMVDVQRYNPFFAGKRVYIYTMDIQVGFVRKNTSTAEPIEADDLEARIVRKFKDRIYSPGQVFGLDIGNAKLKLVVKTIQLADLSLSEPVDEAATDDPNVRGILVENPALEIRLVKDPASSINLVSSSRTRAVGTGIIAPDFKFENLGIGGLDQEFSTIFRRAFASRIFPPHLVERLGLPHVKGMLLHGPPGTGKTLIARQIGKMLNAREPKVINGPEVLNKYIGQSEENIRKMFADAEKEYQESGEESGLHIIIFDELDAVCKQRGTSSDGTGVKDSVVNQLLSKLDGVNQLNNILLIGMTNRKDMIDDALLRPGRFEVQIEIGLPDEKGRVQILKIHTANLKSNKILSGDVDIGFLASATKNFSGAEIAGLVRSATSFAMNRHVTDNARLKDNIDELVVTSSDFLQALEEVRPAFGAPETEIEAVIRRGIIQYNSTIASIISRASKYWDNSPMTGATPGSVNNILLYGHHNCGTTALAAHLAKLSGYPYVKMITLGKLSSMRHEYAKADHIIKVFADAYKSPYSVVILDEVDLLIEYVSLGPRFSNHLLHVLKGKMKDIPPKGHRLLVISTTCNFRVMETLDFRRSFATTIAVPVVRDARELEIILNEAQPFEDPKDIVEVCETFRGRDIDLGIKLLLEQAFIARASAGKTPGQDYIDAINDAIDERLIDQY